MESYKHKCIVKGCTNNLQKDRHLTFFNIPRNRIGEWLQRINPDFLVLNEKAKVGAKICSLHFDDSMMYVRRTLRPEATPIHNLPESADVLNNTGHIFTADKVTETDKGQFPLWESTNLRSMITPQTHEIETNTLATQTIVSQEDVLVMQQKPATNQKSQSIDSCQLLINNAKDEFKKQIFELDKLASKIKDQFKGRHNTTQFKYFAINFYISCTPLYDNLKKTHQLPNPSRLKKLKLDISFRFDSTLLLYLSQKLRLLPKRATYCTLFIDSIDIKPQLHYNITKDQIMGLHLPIQGIAEKASKTYIFMMRGIDTDWRQLITYLLAKRKCFPEIEHCVSYVLRHLFGIGFQTMALVTNQNTISYMFAREVLSVVPEKPYFVLNKREIYLIYEPCDLILQLRNILLEQDLVTEDNTKISWQYVKDLHSHKDKYKLSILPNFTEAHVNPNDEQKRDFKYASQVFNQEVCAILELYISMSLIPKDAIPTVRFMKTIYLLIEVFTSSSLTNESPYKSAFTMNKEQCSLLLYAQEFFKKLKMHNTALNITNKTFECILITMHSLLLLSNKLKGFGISHILTKRLNRHPSETIKAAINKGHNLDWKPTAVALKNILGNIFIKQLIKDKRFYENSNDFAVLIERGEKIATNYVEPAHVTSTKLTPADSDYRFQVPIRRKLMFLSAYLFYKSSKMHRCPKFEEVWSNSSPLEWIPGLSPLLKGCLRTPPVEFLVLINQLDDLFCSKFFTEITRPANKLVNIFKHTIHFEGIICACLPVDYIMIWFVRHRIYSVLLDNKLKSKTNPSSTKILVERLKS